MRFSILITTYNQPFFLEEAINSCYNQTYQKAFEIVVVDDCSSIEYNLNFIEKENIKLIYVKNSRNLGLQMSHNIGVYHSSGDFIIRLDHDDKLKFYTLEKLSDFIDKETNRKIPFIYSDLEIMGENRIRRYPEWIDGSIKSLENIGHLQCYRRDTTLELGGWDCSLKYSADTDFIIRLIEKGYSIKHIPEILVENRLHPEQYTQKWIREGNNSQYWKNLIFQKSLNTRPDIWIEGRQNVIMQTAGSHLWRSETEFINNFLKTQENMLNGLDLGCSNKKKINYAVGIDQNRNGGKTPEIVWDGTKELPFRDGTLDFICGSHIIEHIEDPVQSIHDWGNKLRVGGLLLLVVPHKKFIPNIGTPDGDPTHVADYLPQDFMDKVLNKLYEKGDKWKCLSFDKIQNSWSFDVFLEKM